MRIGFVTTWAQLCGISTYTEQLVDALLSTAPEHEYFAISENDGGAGIIQTASHRVREKVKVVRCWTRQGQANATLLVDAAKRLKLDVLHFQHEDGLFQIAESFLQALRDLRRHGVKTVVTLHTVRPSGGYAHTGFYRELRAAADAIVVHTVQGQAAVTVCGSGAPVLHIPHGTPAALPGGDRLEGLEFLGVPRALLKTDMLWCLVFGFIGPGKNIVCTLRGWAAARAHSWAANVGLIVTGQPGPDEGYAMGSVPAALSETGLGRYAVLRYDFTKTADLPKAFAAADFGVLNTMSPVLSASGQVHLYAAHGVPLAVADAPIYGDAIRAGAIPFQLEVDWVQPSLSLVNAIGALARPAVREGVARGMRRLAKETAWARLAPRYLKLYTRLTAPAEGAEAASSKEGGALS